MNQEQFGQFREQLRTQLEAKWQIGTTARSKDFPQFVGGPTHGMKSGMRGLKWNLCVLTLALLSSAACTAPSVRHEEAVPPVSTVPTGAPEDRRVLAGEWEYEDGGVVTLTLDEQGNGTYPWKDGHFITHSLSDHVWQGIWVQKENDREGGFSLHFSPDFSDGDGRWWYTRIEEDRAPTQKGGSFHLTKKPAHSASSEFSAAP